MNERYIGENLSDAECDLIAITRFSNKLFEGESYLQQHCFFDYRHMHPTKRTYLFAHEYMKSYKALYERYINIDSENIYGLSRPNDPLDNEPPRNKTAKLRTPTCLWTARQVADGACIPYDFYTSAALNYLFQDRFHKAILGQNADSKVRLNIQASALYSDAVLTHVTEKWKDYTNARMIWSENERLAFTEKEMNGKAKPHPYKLDYERYIAKQIMNRHMRIYAIQSALAKRAMRNVLAERAFGSELKDTG